MKNEVWTIQATQSDHGATSVICDKTGHVICKIPSPVWDQAAKLKTPADRDNARLLVAAPKMQGALIRAEKALTIMAEAHEQETKTTEAGGWATDALPVVRNAIAEAGGVVVGQGTTGPQDINDAERLELARQVFNVTFEHAEEFREANIGADLAYLMGAIIGPRTNPEPESVDWSTDEMVTKPEILSILCGKFPANSPLWAFIKTEPEISVKAKAVQAMPQLFVESGGKRARGGR